MGRQVVRVLIVASAPLVASCGGHGSSPRPTHAQDASATSQQPVDANGAEACPTSKIQFTQENGCQNDGSVEFCVPRDDAALKARLSAIAAEISFVDSGGRARCNLTTEQLGMVPVMREDDCASDGAMTDEAWADVCRIASEPGVGPVVATFFE